VVYVDYDPVVLAHARALLVSGGEGATAYIDGDLRDTDRILAEAAELLDFSQPVAITLLAILHAIPDEDDPHAIVAKLLGAVPAGSYLAVSHSGSDLFVPDTKETSSRAPTWWHPVWCRSSSGARTRPWPTRARRRCTAR
jgi:S-adenosyl methyltransferase